MVIDHRERRAWVSGTDIERALAVLDRQPAPACRTLPGLFCVACRSGQGGLRERFWTHQGLHSRRRLLPSEPGKTVLGTLRGGAVVALSRASAPQSRPLRRLSEYPGRRGALALSRAIPESERGARRDLPNQGHAPPSRGSSARSDPSRRAPSERQGPCREPDDRRSAAQRHRQDLYNR